MTAKRAARGSATLEAEARVERAGAPVAEVRLRIVRARGLIDVGERAQRDEAGRPLRDRPGAAVAAAHPVAHAGRGAERGDVDAERDPAGQRHAERHVERDEVIEDAVAPLIGGAADPGDGGGDGRAAVADERLERQIVQRQEPRPLDGEHAVRVVRAAEQRGVHAARRIGVGGRDGRGRGEARRPPEGGGDGGGSARGGHVGGDPQKETSSSSRLVKIARLASAWAIGSNGLVMWTWVTPRVEPGSGRPDRNSVPRSEPSSAWK